jgi:hypothetical protein
MACSVTICRTCYHARVHLAILCICDMRALDAADRDALMAWYGLLFMDSSRSVCTIRVVLWVRYVLCYGLCMRRAVRDDIV